MIQNAETTDNEVAWAEQKIATYFDKSLSKRLHARLGEQFEEKDSLKIYVLLQG